MIRRLIKSLAIINVFLAGVAVALWQLPTPTVSEPPQAADTTATAAEEERPIVVKDTIIREGNQNVTVKDTTATPAAPARKDRKDTHDIASMAKGHPFYSEAAKVLSGKLEEKDAGNRRMILDYCERLRTSYTTKDIGFLRQVFSDEALIIVGNVVKTVAGSGGVTGDERVTYTLRTKHEYLERLEKVFAANKKIDINFSDFRIMRHPTREGIYGVTLRQRYTSDRYADEGYLFLLWDFREEERPTIHVRTWQPAEAVSGEDEVIGINDFNFE